MKEIISVVTDFARGSDSETFQPAPRSLPASPAPGDFASPPMKPHATTGDCRVRPMPVLPLGPVRTTPAPDSGSPSARDKPFPHAQDRFARPNPNPAPSLTEISLAPGTPPG